MATDTLNRRHNVKQLKEIQRGVLEAYARGLLSEQQALRQLGLTRYEELERMLAQAGLRAWEAAATLPERESGSIADGYARFWETFNLD